MVRITQFVQTGDDLLDGAHLRRVGPGLHALPDSLGNQVAHLGHEGVNGNAVARGRCQHPYFADAKGLLADRFGQLHPADALHNEMGSAIRVVHTDPDQSQPGHGGRTFAVKPALLHGNDEHAVGMKAFGQHSTVTPFENIEGKEGRGQQRLTGQRHDRDLFRNIHEH